MPAIVSAPPAERAHAVRQANARILIVRHGAKRGPKLRLRSFRPARYAPMFNDIAKRWPEIGSRLSFWETGNLLPDLHDVTAILFVLQDPLRERFPNCFEDAIQLARRARELGIRVINPPECLSNTIKTTQAQLWHEAGLDTPICYSFSSVDELYSRAKQISGMMIIKADDMHAQMNALVVHDADQLDHVPLDSLPLPGSLSPLIDTRSGYEKIAPNSPYATHYHKMRAMVFGNHVRHNHVFFSESPIVGCNSSSFRHYRSLNPIHRYFAGIKCRDHVRCDLEYHNAACPHTELLSTAAKALGVEFCAIDYSVRSDGSAVLWEANPFFSLHRWPLQVLNHQRRLYERTPHIHAAAADFFRDLLSDET